MSYMYPSRRQLHHTTLRTLATVLLLTGCLELDDQAEETPEVHTWREGATVCATVQRGVSGTVIDSFINQGAPTANNGTGTNLWTGTTPQGQAQSLIKFDLSFIPSGSTVVSANTTMYVSSAVATTIRLHRITAPWVETTVRWNNFLGAFDAATATTFQSGIYGNRTFNITTLAAGWVSGAYANHGFLLEEDLATGQRTGYGASESANVPRRPALTICYDEPVAPPATCGNGALDAGEQCDDGNPSNTDGCTTLCKTATCGDTFVRAGVEECDDGNGSNTDACTTSCALAYCGDGFTRAGVEQCDDANGSDTDACLTSCASATCGDGHIRAGVETCDDGNPSNTDACPASCQPAHCGDGYVQAGVDECDDGNNLSDDGCDAECFEEYCGDGIVQSDEDCEDGNGIDGDGCDNDCTFSSSVDWQTRAPQLVSGGFNCTTNFSMTGRRVSLDEAGTIYLALICGGGVRIVSSTDGGATFSAPIATGIIQTGEAAVAGGPGGVVHVAAVTTAGSGGLVYTRSTDGGATFSPPITLDTNLQTDRVGLAVAGDDVYVLAKSWAASTPLHLFRNHTGGTGAFSMTSVVMDTSYFDVLIDPANDDVWLAANYPGSLRLRRSTDGGATFGTQFIPPGAMAYGDWVIGGGNIMTAGYGSTIVLRVPTSAPTTSNSAGGLPYLPDSKMRSLSATPAGDAVIVSRVNSGAIQLDRLLHGAASVAAPPRTVAAAGTSPGVAILPGGIGAVVVYSVGTTTYATVQVY